MESTCTTVLLTPECRLHGSVVKARNDDTPVHAFKGVPYALPPSGQRRFMPPETHPLWTGTREALEFGPVCPQNETDSAKIYFPFAFPHNMSDDCLYLNVWTPSLQTSAKLPVMVWLFGGSLQVGFGDYYDGTAMAAKQNVVFISLNYRVGAFGFLCTGDDVVKGNMGLLDQIEALRWVQRHVDKFGGDPDNVTVFGESAGAISITHHMVSPLSRGLFRSTVKSKSLFRRAICQSGTCFYPGALFSPQQARKFLDKRLPAMGCTSTDSCVIVKFLQSLPAEEIVKHLHLYSYPVLDEPQFPDPRDVYRTGRCNPVDLMIGFTSHEGVNFIFKLLNAHYVSSKQEAVDIVTRMVKIMFYRGHPAGGAIVEALCDEYFDGLDDQNVTELTKALVEMYGDLLFVVPPIQHALLHSELARTYVYNYEYRISFSSYSSWITADHAHEIPIVIGEPFLDRFPDIWSDTDKRMSDTVMSLWASFARTGAPSYTGLPTWPTYDKDNQSYMNIASACEVKQHYKLNRIRFWTGKLKEILDKSSSGVVSKY